MYISVPIFLQCRTRWNRFEGGTLTDGIFFYLAVSPIVLKKDFITDRMPAWHKRQLGKHLSCSWFQSLMMGTHGSPEQFTSQRSGRDGEYLSVGLLCKCCLRRTRGIPCQVCLESQSSWQRRAAIRGPAFVNLTYSGILVSCKSAWCGPS